MFDPERQLVAIEAAQERYLFICRDRQVAFDPERLAAAGEGVAISKFLQV